MKKIWIYINGKKTVLAELYWLFYIYMLPVLFEKDSLPAGLNKTLLVIGGVLSFFGLGHKAVKQYRNKHVKFYKK